MKLCSSCPKLGQFLSLSSPELWRGEEVINAALSYFNEIISIWWYTTVIELPSCYLKWYTWDFTWAWWHANIRAGYHTWCREPPCNKRPKLKHKFSRFTSLLLRGQGINCFYTISLAYSFLHSDFLLTGRGFNIRSENERVPLNSLFIFTGCAGLRLLPNFYFVRPFCPALHNTFLSLLFIQFPHQSIITNLRSRLQPQYQ